MRPTILLALALFAPPAGAADQPASQPTVRAVAIPVKLSDDAVNFFIDRQFDERGWHVFTGRLGPCSYRLDVPSPIVSFVIGRATLRLEAHATSNCGGPFDVVLEPEAVIPADQLTTEQVKMWLLDLNDRIDDLPVPQWLKDIFGEEFGKRWGIPDYEDNINAFPAALIKKLGLETRFMAQRSVNFYEPNPFELAWEVNDGFLTLTPAVNIQAGIGPTVAPEFWSRLILGEDTDWIDLWSNIQANVKTVRIFDLAGNQHYVRHPGVDTIKYHGGVDEWIMSDLGGTKLNFFQIYVAWVLFETDQTFYLRKYKLATLNDGAWTLATSERYN